MRGSSKGQNLGASARGEVERDGFSGLSLDDMVPVVIGEVGESSKDREGGGTGRGCAFQVEEELKNGWPKCEIA